MNQINEATRMREANKEKAEGEKILLVKAAEADCDAKKLRFDPCFRLVNESGYMSLMSLSPPSSVAREWPSSAR
jgi:hypothetical protein